MMLQMYARWVLDANEAMTKQNLTQMQTGLLGQNHLQVTVEHKGTQKSK